MSKETPRPGSPVRGSRRGKPIMVLFDLLGRRWALGIIWTLADGPKTFRALQEHCDSVSPSVLNARLKELRESGIVFRTDRGYALTDQGAQLFSHLRPIGHWAISWAKSGGPDAEGR